MVTTHEAASADQPLTIIDHTSFPDIISQIFTFATLPVLTSFLQTSRGYRDSREIDHLVKNEIYRHLILTTGEPNKFIYHHHKPYLISAKPVPHRYPAIGFPLSPPDDTTHRLDMTKVLDIVTNNYHPSEYPSFPSLEVVRMFGRGSNNCPVPKCDTVIVSSSEHLPVLLDPGEFKRLVFPLASCQFLDSESYNSTSTGIGRVNWAPSGHVEEVVFIVKKGERVGNSWLYEFVENVEWFLQCSAPRTPGLVFDKVVVVGIGETFLQKWDMLVRKLEFYGFATEEHVQAREKFVFYEREEYERMLDGELWIELVE